MENEIKFIFQKKLLIFGIDAVGKSALISAIGRSDMKDENKYLKIVNNRNKYLYKYSLI